MTKINIPTEIKTLMQALLDRKFDAYIIGGAIRDSCLGLKPKDWDMFTDTTGKEILSIFPKGVIIGGKERQEKILTVIVDKTEVSQYRNNGGRTELGVNFEKHLATCDFTINSLASDITGNIVDNHGGLNDLHSKILRCVGEPHLRFKEDLLRILRGIRFICKYNLKVDPATKKEMQNQMGRLKELPGERIREELFKILEYKNAFKVFRDYGLYYIIPPIQKAFHLEHGDHHDEDVYQHMENSFETSCDITDNILLRFAIGFHDIGKPDTKDYTEGKGITFYGHDKVGADLIVEIMNKLKFSNDEIKYVKFLVYRHMYSLKDGVPNNKSYAKFFFEMEQAGVSIEEFNMLLYCDNQANEKNEKIKFGDWTKNSVIVKKYYELKYSRHPFAVKDLAISGKDLIDKGLEPGPNIGTILNKAFDEVQEGNIKNERPFLMGWLKTYLNNGYGKMVKDKEKQNSKTTPEYKVK